VAQRYCTNCGAELREDASLCGKCGRPVHETARVSIPEADVPVPPPPTHDEATATVGIPQDQSVAAAGLNPRRCSNANRLEYDGQAAEIRVARQT
jgi:hypothetical protein